MRVLIALLLLAPASGSVQFLDRMKSTENAVKAQTKANPEMSVKNAEEAKRTVYQHETGLHDAMRAMMDDDDDDDTMMGSKNTAFLQGKGQMSEDAYMQDSANSLSEALGPRWNSKTLEATADRNTQALLQGIANPKALNGLNGMMHAMMNLR